VKAASDGGATPQGRAPGSQGQEPWTGEASSQEQAWVDSLRDGEGHERP